MSSIRHIMCAVEHDVETSHQFRKFLARLFNIAQIPDNICRVLLSGTNFAKFKQAFTHKTASEVCNYEVFETIGDATLNKCVVWYFKRMIADVSPERLTLLKIKFASTKMMSVFAKEMGFDKYVLMHPDMNKHKFKILEDILESFIGCLEYTIDETTSIHNGFKYAYNFVAYYIEKYIQNIGMSESDLLDAVSRLKNISDKHKLSIEYIHDSINIHGARHIRTQVILNGNIVLANSTARSKKQSKQMAAEIALNGFGGRCANNIPREPLNQ